MTDTQTHSHRTDCSTWTTKVVSNKSELSTIIWGKFSPVDRATWPWCSSTSTWRRRELCWQTVVNWASISYSWHSKDVILHSDHHHQQHYWYVDYH